MSHLCYLISYKHLSQTEYLLHPVRILNVSVRILDASYNELTLAISTGIALTAALLIDQRRLPAFRTKVTDLW